ncbi:MAG: TRAP transporter small permease subunit [Pseudodonghicola sp.]|nr:TRAP transporter small permease subunit [Pseudodonghicola sp.]
MSGVSSRPGGVGPLPGWFRALRRMVDRVTGGLNVAGTLLILALMLLVNADVIGRGAFSAPISGVPEMVSMSIVAIVFLQIAQTFRKGRMTRAEAVLNTLGRVAPRLRLGLELIFALAAAALVWILFSASLPLFEKAWMRGTYEGTVGDFTAPIWPVKLIILVGCGALWVQLVLSACETLLRLIQGEGRR